MLRGVRAEPSLAYAASQHRYDGGMVAWWHAGMEHSDAAGHGGMVACCAASSFQQHFAANMLRTLKRQRRQQQQQQQTYRCLAHSRTTSTSPSAQTSRST